MAWAVRLSTQNGLSIREPWLTRFRNLGRTGEYQGVADSEIKTKYFDRAIQKCEELALHSERGLALIFDTEIQNGERGLSRALEELTISTESSLQTDEVGRMTFIAQTVADSSNPRYRADVLNRKMIFATGSGVLHGTNYDLSAYGVTLKPWKK